MKQILAIAQIVVSILLMLTVLIQQEKGGIYKGEGGFYRTLRGVEKKIFWITLFFGSLFIILALLNLVL